MNEITLTIDGKIVKSNRDDTILKAARNAAFNIPTLCDHPDLIPAPGLNPVEIVFQGDKTVKDNSSGHVFEGCRLCIVEIENSKGTYTACDTPVADGMVINTNTPKLRELRRKCLAEILADHPHTCLLCAQREGCSLSHCSSGVPIEERCCPKFSNCELRKLAEYIGIKEDICRYIPGHLPVINSEPLIVFDYNLCIGCLRCVRACRDFQGKGALGFVYQDEKVIIGTIAQDLRESGCKFCGACIEVCPTGTLTDKSERAKTLRAGKLSLSLPVLPPAEIPELIDRIIDSLPDTEGVYQLLDEHKQIIYIKGTMNLRRELKEQLETNKKARYFKWEKNLMFTIRESELIQQFLQAHAKLPLQNDELADLY